VPPAFTVGCNGQEIALRRASGAKEFGAEIMPQTLLRLRPNGRAGRLLRVRSAALFKDEDELIAWAAIQASPLPALSLIQNADIFLSSP